jgi:hypothetical protein
MTKLRVAAWRMCAAAFIFFSGAAFAQAACADGRAADGSCVDPAFAAAMRQTAMIYSQPKISSTHYPVLPVDDGSFQFLKRLDNIGPLPGGNPDNAEGSLRRTR